ncbi:hypothetical protein MOD91_18265 [Bacillus haynesii]|uniref:hypothetical protein n=1 Tax=Bacillus haynesii TaxID=1925021 RepID=UPI00227F24C0|nr:hypothetical protein [Bacillus haynesii]MCY8048468.1 hypothetical protein [Bacillus haynesii]MCY8668806.1 hypothetical protein [Bacillus haynesii]
MNVSQQIIDILNKDEKAKNLMKEFNHTAKEQGLKDDEYASAREVVLLLCMRQNDEVMKMMADELWEEINGGNN